MLFEERAVHFQCKPCNGNLTSRKIKDVTAAYDAFMVRRYGKKEVMKLELQSRQSKQFTVPELEGLIARYRRELADLGN